MPQQVQNLPAVQETQEMRIQSLGQEDPREKEMATTPVFLSEKSHGQRSLVGDSPGVTKESDTTEQLSNSNILVYYLDIRTIWRYCIVSFKSQ